MKNKKTLGAIIGILLIAIVLIVIGFALPKTKKTSKIDQIVENISKSTYFTSLNKEHNITFEKKGNIIEFVLENKIIEVSITSEEKLNFIINKYDTIDRNISLILIDSVFRYYKYGDKIYNAIETMNDYNFSQMGVLKTELKEDNIEVTIDFSKKYAIPKNIDYIDEEILKYSGYDEKLEMQTFFYVNANKILAVKGVTKDFKGKIDIIEEDGRTDNTYKTVLTFAKMILSEEDYNDFIKDFTELKTITYDSFEVVVDYEPLDYEDVAMDENDSLVRIFY